MAAGVEAAKAYLRRPLRVQGEIDDADCPISAFTRKPRLYRRVAFRDRLLPVLASMPKDFFQVVTEDRNVWFLASASTPGLNMPDPDVVGLEHGSRTVAVHPLGWERVTRDVQSTPIDHWAVLLGRIAIELCDGKAFAGTVVHELCHVYLEHDLNLPDLTDDVWKRTEDEAIALACEIGFREETEAQLSSLHALFGDDVETGNLPPQ